ncbi:MAG: cytochrome C assembly protein [Proteobacteria bacterium]|nr:MAG: cytochrome C assembly protein [Pseudomonadota bacterium]
MVDANKQDRLTVGLGLAAAVIAGICWFYGLKFAPTDQAQGEVYRILYFHVPSAFTAFLFSAFLMFFSVWTLFKRSPGGAIWAKATAEVGLIFTLITLMTGSIWGRPTWGVWWDWDARLTTTLILALLYAGYLIFTSSMAPGPSRDRMAAALGVIIAIDVPIIYKSVTWWRTLHQPPSLMRQGGSTMDPQMVRTLMMCWVAMTLIAVWMLWTRAVNLRLQQRIEEHSHGVHN